MQERDRRILELASTQLWLITTPQLEVLGVSRSGAYRRRRAGLLEMVHRHVARIGPAPQTQEQRLLAACLEIGPDAAVSHRSATWLWGAPGFDADCVDVSVPRPRQPRLDRVFVHRSRDLCPAHLTQIGLLPVTTPARTLLDLAGSGMVGLVERVLEDWVVRRLVRGADLEVVLAELARPGRQGVSTLREALMRQHLMDEAPDSTAEILFRKLIARYHVPVPVFHHRVELGPHVFELDFAYPAVRAAVEIDGRTLHERRRTAETDRWRQHLLEDAGWRVRRYLADQLRRRPGTVASELRHWLAGLTPVPPRR